MDNKKRKIYVFVPLILWTIFVLIALVILFVFSKYYRAYRFWELYIALIVVACLFLLSSIVFTIIGLIKVPKNIKFVPIIEIGINAVSVVATGIFIFIIAVSYSFGGHSDYVRLQKVCGTPQAFLSLGGDGSHYHLNNKDYPAKANNDPIYDSDSVVFNIIYNAPYKKVEKIDEDTKTLNYAQYTVNDRGDFRYLIIYENGEAYAYDSPDLLYVGGTQCFKFDVKTAEEIITATNDIIASYLAS